MWLSHDMKEEYDDEDDWNPCKAAGVCLSLMATCCESDIVPHVLPYVDQHLQNPDWKFRDAAIMALGEREGGRVGERQGKKGGREGGREAGEEGREGEWEGGREGGREGMHTYVCVIVMLMSLSRFHSRGSRCQYTGRVCT